MNLEKLSKKDLEDLLVTFTIMINLLTPHYNGNGSNREFIEMYSSCREMRQVLVQHMYEMGFSYVEVSSNFIEGVARKIVYDLKECVNESNKPDNS